MLITLGLKNLLRLTFITFDLLIIHYEINVRFY